jgi:protein-S-isoprenylcysteine O-methyltransferase Ste14
MKELEAKKVRNWVLYPYFIIYFFVIAGNDLNFSLGLPLIILGFLLRFYASGFISKSKSLCTCGPYSLIRHPLYAGSFLIGLGLSAISNNYYLVLFFVIAFALCHFTTIVKEEKYLLDKFGPKFSDYKAKVPAFFPNFLPYKSNPHEKFNLNQVIINGEIIRIIGISLLIFLLYLIEEFTYRRASLGISQLILLLWFSALFAFLWVNLKIRKRILANHLNHNH